VYFLNPYYCMLLSCRILILCLFLCIFFNLFKKSLLVPLVRFFCITSPLFIHVHITFCYVECLLANCLLIHTLYLSYVGCVLITIIHCVMIHGVCPHHYQFTSTLYYHICTVSPRHYQFTFSLQYDIGWLRSVGSIKL